MTVIFLQTLLKSRVITGSFFVLCGIGVFFPGFASAQENRCSIHWKLAVCQPASFRSHGKTYFEMEQDRRVAATQAEARRQANSWPTAFVKITDTMKNPNSIKLPFAQAPGISAKTREQDGRRVCAGSLKTGEKSQQDKDVHVDRECCLDKDEIPNPRCYYPQLGANNNPKRP